MSTPTFPSSQPLTPSPPLTQPTQSTHIPTKIEALAQRIRDLGVFVRNVQVNHDANALRFDIVTAHDCVTVQLTGAEDGIRCAAVQTAYRTTVDMAWAAALRDAGADAFEATVELIRFVSRFSKNRRQAMLASKARGAAVANVRNASDRHTILRVYDLQDRLRLTDALFVKLFEFTFLAAFDWADRQPNHRDLWARDPFWAALRGEFEHAAWRHSPIDWLGSVANAKYRGDGTMAHILSAFIDEFWVQVHLFLGEDAAHDAVRTHDRPRSLEALYDDLRNRALREEPDGCGAHLPATLRDAVRKVKVAENMRAFCTRVRDNHSEEAGVKELAEEVLSLLDDTWLEL